MSLKHLSCCVVNHRFPVTRLQAQSCRVRLNHFFLYQLVHQSSVFLSLFICVYIISSLCVFVLPQLRPPKTLCVLMWSICRAMSTIIIRSLCLHQYTQNVCVRVCFHQKFLSDKQTFHTHHRWCGHKHRSILDTYNSQTHADGQDSLQVLSYRYQLFSM